MSGMARSGSTQVHWVVRLNYRNRSLSFMLLFGVIALHWLDDPPGPLLWVLLAMQLLIYPHIAYQLARRASLMLRAETIVMLLDAGLFGCWVAVLGFPLWISFAMLVSVHINLVAFRGVPGLLSCMAASLTGVLVGMLLADVEPRPDSSMQVTLACMVALSLYLLAFSHSAHLRSLSLRDAKEQLRNSQRQLQRKLEEINALQIQLRELAHRDPLTGLYNRRHLDAQLLDNVVNRKADSNLCLLLIDIDLFKRINDEFGHQAGDQVLARLAGLLTSHCRSSDIICRYGGEEFVVLMPEVTIGAAVERADAIRLAFTGLKMRFNNRDLAPTLSVGIAACPLHATSGDRLFECADQALYRAKAAGRNRTVLWSADRLSPTDPSTI